MLKTRNISLLILKILLGSYILFCLIIAGLNYGVAPTADAATAKLISDIWHFYENEYKTALIFTASILSIICIRKNERSRMRIQNYIGFIISAFVIHITGPAVTGTHELYFFSMPLPWASFSIQVFDTSTAFHGNFAAHWGTAGLGMILCFVIIYNVFVIFGTLLFGRRLQCSQICMFNGFASEVFSSAFPLFGRRQKKAGKRLKTFFTVLRGFIFAAAIFFTAASVLTAAGLIDASTNALLYRLETLKYLSVELLMAMFFWVVFTGRGYCYYCPAGTFLAFLSKAAGQRITTDSASCIGCRKCDKACPMSIDISSRALQGEPVISMNCVGCGRCVDVCPVETLRYTTRFLDLIMRRSVESH